jgi:hypothetical protein
MVRARASTHPARAGRPALLLVLACVLLALLSSSASAQPLTYADLVGQVATSPASAGDEDGPAPVRARAGQSASAGAAPAAADAPPAAPAGVRFATPAEATPRVPGAAAAPAALDASPIGAGASRLSGDALAAARAASGLGGGGAPADPRAAALARASEAAAAFANPGAPAGPAAGAVPGDGLAAPGTVVGAGAAREAPKRAAAVGANGAPLPDGMSILTQGDSDALLTFKDGATNWEDLVSWGLKGWTDNSSPCVGWTGVTCSASKRVVALDLSGWAVKGRLAPELAAMDELKTLNLSSCDLTGGLPPAWAAFPKLQALDASDNPRLAADLPAGWAKKGALPALATLALRNAGLAGPLPDEWATAAALKSLAVLDVSGNEVKGPLPEAWAATEGAFRKLRVLNLANNSIAGPLPESWGSSGAASFPALTSLDLGRNLLSGPLPAVWGSGGGFAQLTELHLQLNRLVGRVPEAWGEPDRLPRLTWLDLYGNRLFGPFPEGWGLKGGGVPRLTVLSLRPGNPGLCGKVPPQLRAAAVDARAAALGPAPLGACPEARERPVPTPPPTAAPPATTEPFNGLPIDPATGFPVAEDADGNSVVVPIDPATGEPDLSAVTLSNGTDPAAILAQLAPPVVETPAPEPELTPEELGPWDPYAWAYTEDGLPVGSKAALAAEAEAAASLLAEGAAANATDAASATPADGAANGTTSPTDAAPAAAVPMQKLRVGDFDIEIPAAGSAGGKPLFIPPTPAAVPGANGTIDTTASAIPKISYVLATYTLTGPGLDTGNLTFQRALDRGIRKHLGKEANVTLLALRDVFPDGTVDDTQPLLTEAVDPAESVDLAAIDPALALADRALAVKVAREAEDAAGGPAEEEDGSPKKKAAGDAAAAAAEEEEEGARRRRLLQAPEATKAGDAEEEADADAEEEEEGGDPSADEPVVGAGTRAGASRASSRRRAGAGAGADGDAAEDPAETSDGPGAGRVRGAGAAGVDNTLIPAETPAPTKKAGPVSPAVAQARAAAAAVAAATGQAPQGPAAAAAAPAPSADDPLGIGPAGTPGPLRNTVQATFLLTTVPADLAAAAARFNDTAATLAIRRELARVGIRNVKAALSMSGAVAPDGAVVPAPLLKKPVPPPPSPAALAAAAGADKAASRAAGGRKAGAAIGVLLALATAGGLAAFFVVRHRRAAAAAGAVDAAPKTLSADAEAGDEGGPGGYGGHGGRPLPASVPDVPPLTKTGPGKDLLDAAVARVTAGAARTDSAASLGALGSAAAALAAARRGLGGSRPGSAPSTAAGSTAGSSESAGSGLPDRPQSARPPLPGSTLARTRSSDGSGALAGANLGRMLTTADGRPRVPGQILPGGRPASAGASGLGGPPHPGGLRRNSSARSLAMTTGGGGGGNPNNPLAQLAGGPLAALAREMHATEAAIRQAPAGGGGALQRTTSGGSAGGGGPGRTSSGGEGMAAMMRELKALEAAGLSGPAAARGGLAHARSVDEATAIRAIARTGSRDGLARANTRDVVLASLERDLGLGGGGAPAAFEAAARRPPGSAAGGGSGLISAGGSGNWAAALPPRPDSADGQTAIDRASALLADMEQTAPARRARR